MIIYFAHSILSYGTSYEKTWLKILKKYYPNDIVINPSEIKNPGSGMETFKEKIVKSDLLIFTSCYNFIGKGIYEEIKMAKSVNISIFWLHMKIIIPYEDIFFMKYDLSNWKKRYCLVLPKIFVERIKNGISNKGGTKKNEKINYKKENIALAKTIFKESKTRKEKLQKLASLEITDKDFDQVEKILVKMTTLKQRQEELIKKQGNEIIATITHRKIIKTRKEDWLKAHRGKKKRTFLLLFYILLKMNRI